MQICRVASKRLDNVRWTGGSGRSPARSWVFVNRSFFKRERERERECACIYIYIYTHIQYIISTDYIELIKCLEYFYILVHTYI